MWWAVYLRGLKMNLFQGKSKIQNETGIHLKAHFGVRVIDEGIIPDKHILKNKAGM